jgi:acyl-CoA reductase-like NAD-dependent aldehyde dehydrogenase
MSGFGKDGGEDGFKEWSVVKTVVMKFNSNL